MTSYSFSQPQQPVSPYPLAPGAPDFPPVSPRNRVRYGHGSVSSHRSQSQPAVPPQDLEWIQHQHQLQQSPSRSQAGSSSVLSTPDVAQSPVPTRPVSPRPQLGDSHGPGASTASTVPSNGYIRDRTYSSPQPRRNTLPAAPVASPARSYSSQHGQYEQPMSHQHAQYTPQAVSPQPSSSTVRRRPLPAAPTGPRATAPTPVPSYSPLNNPAPSPAFSQSFSTSPSPSPSPALSRSSSAASQASISSSSSQRRPLPKPPSLASVPDDTPRAPIKSYTGPEAGRSNSSAESSRPRPASYAQAEAEVRGGATNGIQSLKNRMQKVGMSEQGVSQQKLPPSISLPGSASPSPVVPTISFDDEDEDGPPAQSASRGPPSISIGIAPPSPSLKATSSFSDNYFDSSVPDEKHPLPVSSVPMHTSTAPSSSSLSGKSTYALACPACSKPVLYGRTVNAMGKRWHPDCFTCAECSKQLEHLEFFTKDGKPYCHVDYHELFSIRCSHCQTPIVDESYITITDDALGGTKTFHELHFFCANCGDPFIDPKKRSSANGQQGEDEYLAKPFTVHKGHPYCENCNQKLHLPKCSNCKKPIKGDVLRAMNKNWCEDCFVCDNCLNPFEDGTFLVYKNKPHCESCYKIKLRSEV